MTDAFPNLFQALTIGSTTVPNRLFVTAHNTQFATQDPDGYHRWSMLGDRAAAYYEDRAKGGFGLQVIGQTQVHPQSGIDRPASFLPEVVEHYRAIADACHRHGSKVFVQLNQNGREKGSSGPDSWDPVWSVSPEPVHAGEMAKQMEHDDIRALIEGFASSAVHCKDAGMDGVEIHAAHPHLLGVWLTSAYNRRTDEYGGSLPKRLRLVTDILEAVRSAVGRGFTVGVRMNGVWKMPGGQTIEESLEMARILVGTGLTDFLDISGVPTIDTIGTPFGALIPWAAKIKQAVPEIPVFAVGRVVTPAHADDIVGRGDADMVGMTRASIADPELPMKAREGRAREIRTCVGAGQGCLMRNHNGRPMTCQQNPAVGRERVWGIGTLSVSQSPKAVAVVGGGPAGLEVAVVAAERDHRVTLFESALELGGQIRLITRNPRREEFGHIVAWRAERALALGVEIRTGVKVDATQLIAEAPDTVVIATGARPLRNGWYSARPDMVSLPGFDQSNVVTSWDVIEGKCDGAQHVAVVDAHGYHQTADAVEYLARLGARVSLFYSGQVLLPEVEDNERPYMMAALRESNLDLYPSSVVEALEGPIVRYRDLLHDAPHALSDVDNIVLSFGSKPVDDLYYELAAAAQFKVVRIGDALAPRGVEHAVFEGHRLGREL